MVKRLLLGPVLIAVVVLLCYLDELVDRTALPGGGGGTFPPGMIVGGICLILAWGGALELAEMLRAKGVQASRFVTPLAAAAGMLACCTALLWPGEGVTGAAMGSGAALSLLLSQVYYSRAKTVEGSLAAAGGTLLSLVYLGLMFGCVVLIRAEHSVWMLVWVLLTTKSSDIGAYFTGKAIGRHKLIFWLSPGKTWEGLVGGTVFAGLVGAGGLWVVHRLTGIAVPGIWTGLVAGMLFAIFGQLGDLGESLFKRDAGMKDSGRSLPGFGGILDVLDSLILVAPAAYWWMRMVAPEGS